MKKFLQVFGMLMLLFGIGLNAQKAQVTGIVADDSETVVGATVVIDGTTTGTLTDIDGKYTLLVEPGTHKLRASFVGYSPVTKTVTVTAGQVLILDFILQSGVIVDEVIVTGTRAVNRTNLQSAVPIDVINIEKISTATPQTSINQLLNQTAPSFSSNTQTISDGTDHIDPASLRGLGPDQVLVLVNGKRRHTSSLVNVNGTFGRGNVGTDLNAIPVSAIKKIEVLRDGAAAQYGSDAIAGVINIQLKEKVNEFNVSVTGGGNFSSEIGPFGGEEKSVDGETFVIGANYGLPLGQNGFINLTGEFDYRNATNRMREFEGDIFHAMNGVEREASAAVPGIDVTQMSLSDIQTYAPMVDYIDASTLADLNALSTIDSLGDVLNYDVTDEELAARGQTRSDYNMRVGQSQVRGGKFFGNLSYGIGENQELYLFGGSSYRRGSSGCFYRLPGQSRTSTSIYPNGTVPIINSNISDNSIGGGIRGTLGKWNSDISVVTGMNKFLFNLTNAHNATLGASSPTSFNNGGHAFRQTTSNIDFSRYFEFDKITGLNLAYGGEYRQENFKVIPGTELSYGNFDVNGNLVNSTTPDSLITTDLFGRTRPSGCQCFAGFLPSNEIDANRSSFGAYLDGELDITDELLIGAAFRYENYSDFGSTFNYKATARYLFKNNFAVRAAFATGFRAPSLHQIHFSRTSTIFTLVEGVSVPQEVGVFANTSRAAELLGIPNLKEETSQNISLGFTAKIPVAGLRITADVYQVNIDDRIILTGQFAPGTDPELQNIFDQAGATAAAFFANAINTKSQGLDVVLAHSIDFKRDFTLTNELAATFSRTEWIQEDGINASPLLEEKDLVGTYFNQESRLYLEQAVPRMKITLGHTLTVKKLAVYLRNTYFGETTEATSADIFDDELNLIDNSIDPYNAGKVITDASLGYNFSERFRLTVGANNVFDIYPDESDPTFTSSGRFVYSRRSPQFSYNGRYLFARVGITL